MDANKILESVTLEVLEGPTGRVDDENWPHLHFKVRLSRNGREVWTGDWRAGLGLVKPTAKDERDAHALFQSPRAPEGAGPIISTIRKHPHSVSRIADKEANAAAIAWCAKRQGYAPTVADLMGSLMQDGTAYFDAETFEEWASNFGYDIDSRKAESVYRACDTIGRALARAFDADELAALRDWAAEQ